MLKKLFGGLKMTWPRVILFAVLTGVYTALMALFAPDGSSFREIAVYPEAWILFAILIICGCKTPLEAACKTFVFFLISQPLVYLIQVPFNSMGWQLFGYYRYWFIATLLTFPGAFLGWYIKKDNLWSALILSVMLVLLTFLGVGFLKDMLLRFPNHLLSVLFCFGLVVVLIFGVLRNKKARLAAGAISLAALILLLVLTFGSGRQERLRANILEARDLGVDEGWTVSVSDESLSTGEIAQNFTGEYELYMHFYKPGPNTVTLTDPDGNAYQLIISLDESDRINVETVP